VEETEMSIQTAEPNAVDALRDRVRGRVTGPDDPDYDDVRTIVSGEYDLHPAAIVRVADARDVARAIAAARELDLEIAVRSGGHSGAGHGSTEGGVVIDLRALKQLEIDVAGRTAWAGAGLTALEVTSALAEHGLAIGFGDTGSVGIGGITLGGGVGYLVRKHGLTIDSLLAAEIVTADGQVRIIDEDHEPDLFWAIRGGGGNFGVVTRFRFRLHELPGIVGGLLILPATADTIAGFVAAAGAAPDDLSSIANVMPCPPMPFVDAAHHGEVVILSMMVWAGDPAAAEEALAPFRSLATPVADLVHPGPFTEVYPPDDPDYHPTAVARNLFVDRIGRAEAGRIVEHLEASDAPIRVAQIRVLGGAAARIPADATAYAHRASPIMINVASFYEGEADRPIRQAWVEGLVRDLLQEDTGVYVNFLVDEGEARIRAAYPGTTWDRLVAIKRHYDPDNVFRRNQNVPPTPA
jgi:FAD/FMN-containing dehydrogenase